MDLVDTSLKDIDNRPGRSFFIRKETQRSVSQHRSSEFNTFFFTALVLSECFQRSGWFISEATDF